MVIGKCSKFITAPIFYVNAYPHIGHLYTAVLGDTFKRWFDLKGISCKYSIGTDEHGLKVQQAALATQQKPLEFCDSVSQRFDYLFKTANISNSVFIRTTDYKHQQVVLKLWNKLTENGYIYKGEHEGWYSVSDEVFVPESLVVHKGGQGYSKETGKSLEWTTEENYKFKLSLFKDRLLDWLQSKENIIYPAIHQLNVIKQLEEGVSDISISRLASKVSWGIPVPNNDSHVIYVWLDALANYLTAANYPSKGWDNTWPPTLQIVGKDILKFHAIYWPAFLMAAGMKLPQKILSHGHWLVSKQKMSKSLGNGVDPLELISTFGEDAIRYFLVRDGHVEIDPEFTLNTVWRRYNHDLAGQLGNIVMRCSSAKINKDGEIPDKLSPGELSKLEVSLLETCESLAEKCDDKVQQLKLHSYLELVSNLVSELNRYWSLEEPWKFKKTGQEHRLSNLMYITFEIIRIACILFLPAMPTKAAAVLDQMQVPANQRTYIHAKLGKGPPNRKMLPSIPLFPQQL